VPIIEIERLEPASDDSQKKAALSACIAAEIGNGIPRDQAVAMCNSMVAERTQMNMMNQLLEVQRWRSKVTVIRGYV
jgi:hypothetical protein